MMTTKAAYFYDLKVISDDKENVENLKLIDLILPGGFFQVTKYDEKGKPETFPLTLNPTGWKSGSTCRSQKYT